MCFATDIGLTASPPTMITHKVKNIDSNHTEAKQKSSRSNCNIAEQNLINMARITDLPPEIRAQILGYLLYCPTEHSVPALIEIVGLARISDCWEAIARRKLRNEVNAIIRAKGRLLDEEETPLRSLRPLNDFEELAAEDKLDLILAKKEILKQRITLLEACLDDIWDGWGEAPISIALWKREQKL